jgi:HD-GYP domain-containing protein (c-di-GMP phosphodiesterase class II)
LKFREVDPGSLSVDTDLEYDILDAKNKVLVQAGTLLSQDIIDSLASMKGEIFCNVAMDAEDLEIRGASLFSQTELVSALEKVEQVCTEIKSVQAMNQENVDIFLDIVTDLFDIMRTRRVGRLNLVKAETSGWAWFHVHLLNSMLLVMNFTFNLKVKDDEIKACSLGALIHDIGYLLKTPTELFSEKQLSNEEKKVFIPHVASAYEKIKELSLPDQVKQAILFHHERFDETGYPMGLPSDRIPSAAKYTAIAETFETMHNPRPYKTSKKITEVLREMVSFSNKQFEKELLFKFLSLMGPQLMGNSPILLRNTVIKTNLNEIGRINHQNSDWLRPEIQLLLDRNNRIIGKPFHINLANDRERYIAAAYSFDNSRKLLKTVFSRLNMLTRFNKEEQKLDPSFKPIS